MLRIVIFSDLSYITNFSLMSDLSNIYSLLSSTSWEYLFPSFNSTAVFVYVSVMWVKAFNPIMLVSIF